MSARFLLNAFCVLSSMVCKAPQIRDHFRRKSANGISIASLILETTSLSITFSYFSVNDYPVSDYLEYPFLLGQNLLLFIVVVLFEQVPTGKAVPMFASYCIGLYALSQKIIPLAVVSFLSSLVIPMSSMSKIAQIRSIYDTKRGDLVSRVPWLVYAVTSLARIYTVFIESADGLLLLQYSVSVVLNLAVVGVAVMFTTNEGKRKV